MAASHTYSGFVNESLNEMAYFSATALKASFTGIDESLTKILDQAYSIVSLHGF